jgi:hypothetical protein
MNLSLPVKTRAAGKVALDAAREAGDKFRAVKFDLQRRPDAPKIDNFETIRRDRLLVDFEARSVIGGRGNWVVSVVTPKINKKAGHCPALESPCLFAALFFLRSDV